jgi:hypothetical protein
MARILYTLCDHQPSVPYCSHAWLKLNMPGVHAVGDLSPVLRSGLALLPTADALIAEIKQNGKDRPGFRAAAQGLDIKPHYKKAALFTHWLNSVDHHEQY